MATTPHRGVNDVLASIRDLSPKDYRALKTGLVGIDAERDSQIERMRDELAAQSKRFDRIIQRVSADREKTAAVEAAAAPTAGGAKRKKKVKRTKSAAGKRLFRNPDNKDQTWSGFGPMPAWMRESGKPKEAFLVS